MGVVAYFCYGLVHVALLVLSVRLWRRDGHRVGLLLCASVCTLVYDNFIISLGSFIGDSSLLRGLNYVRYVLHVLTTPLLIYYGLVLAASAGLAWARTRPAQVGLATLSIVMMAWAASDNLLNLQMQLTSYVGTLRYANAGIHGPPVPELVTISALIVYGVAVFMRTRWAWMAVGSIVIFILAGAGPALGLLGNFGEIALMSGLVATVWRFPLVVDPGPELAASRVATS